MKKALMVGLASVAVFAGACAAPPPAYVSPTTTVAPVVSVTLPEVQGRNGAVVVDELRGLGLTKVKIGSDDAKHTVVVLPQNWTAVAIEPAPGSVVRSDSTVVVVLTKEN